MHSDDYHLIHIKNDTEEIINNEASFDKLPRNSTLKFKKRPPDAIALPVPLAQNQMSNDQIGSGPDTHTIFSEIP